MLKISEVYPDVVCFELANGTRVTRSMFFIYPEGDWYVSRNTGFANELLTPEGWKPYHLVTDGRFLFKTAEEAFDAAAKG
jgi:hypothetical protein